MPVSINGNGSITGLVITTADLADGSVTTAKIADSAITSGKIADGAVATADIADSAVTTAKIANANVTVAKISATGTADSTTYLRGDGSWQVVSTTPTTDQVLTATAAATFGAVGTYAWLANAANATLNSGSTIAGSSLRTNTTMNGGQGVGGSSYGAGGTAVSGTWRKVSGTRIWTDNGCSTFSWYPGLFLRIS
jgi:hypothetical protein